MRLNIKSLKSESEQSAHFVFNERLPSFVVSPCEVDCCYQLHRESDYILLSMHIKGELHIDCQRCLGRFAYHYDNHTTVALCSSEDVADRLMSDYECIVIDDAELDLDDVILDEIHLYAPQKHLDHAACDVEAIQHLNPKKLVHS